MNKILVTIGLCFFCLLQPALILAAPTESIGKIEVPVGTQAYNQESGQPIALVFFVSNLLKLSTVVAGIWTLVNFVLAGFKFLTSQGDPGTMTKVTTKITQSIFGIVLIAIAYTATAVIGLVLFGQADIFLNPQVTGPATITAPY